MIGDWQRAIRSFKQALEAHEVVFGAQDKKTTYVSKLLSVSVLEYSARWLSLANREVCVGLSCEESKSDVKLEDYIY